MGSKKVTAATLRKVLEWEGGNHKGYRACSRGYKNSEKSTEGSQYCQAPVQLTPCRWGLHHHLWLPASPHHSCYIVTSGESDLGLSSELLGRVGSTKAKVGEAGEDFSPKGDFYLFQQTDKNMGLKSAYWTHKCWAKSISRESECAFIPRQFFSCCSLSIRIKNCLYSWFCDT